VSASVPQEATPAKARPGQVRFGPAWLVLVVLSALAWVVTIAQARGMGVGLGTMGLALPLFLLLWVVMMAAMMFPSVAPVAILWSRSIVARSTGTDRVFRMTTFLTGYLVAWTAYGLVAFVALLGAERLTESSPEAARWLGVAIFTLAGIYQLTPMKDACLRHCRSPVMSLLHYGNIRGRIRDLRVGLHHGLYCVGCCWGLMIVLVAVGVMNVAAMVALASVIYLEKLWRRGPILTRVVGVAFVAIAVLTIFYPQLLPAPHPGSNPMISETGGM
jgi:predicted metal-binding membrane protein